MSSDAFNLIVSIRQVVKFITLEWFVSGPRVSVLSSIFHRDEKKKNNKKQFSHYFL